MWIIIIIGVIGYILYKFFRARDKMLQSRVDAYGGMTEKYKDLIEALILCSSGRVVMVARDVVKICIDEGMRSEQNYLISEDFNGVVVKYNGVFRKHTWAFEHNYPQDKMLIEIKHYLKILNIV